MILRRLVLHNAIGIQRGLGIDTLKIPFDKFGEGLILLKGRIGTGKSTILKNLTPFRSVASEKFNDFNMHFAPKGYKELEFLFKKKNYLCQVHGHTAKIFEDGELLNTDEKVSSYDEIVESIFGKKDYFFKMMFSGREISSISDLTKGQRKDIIIDYLADYLQVYGKLNKWFGTKKEIANENLIKVRAYLESYQEIESQLEVLYQDLEELDSNEEELETYLEKLTKSKSKVQKELTDLQNKKLLVWSLKDQKKTLENMKAESLQSLYGIVETLSLDIKNCKQSLEQLEEELDEVRVEIQETSVKKTVDPTKRKFYEAKLRKAREDIEKYNSLLNTYNQYQHDAEVLDKQVAQFKKQSHPCTKVLQERRKAVQIKMNTFKSSMHHINIKVTTKEYEELEEIIRVCDAWTSSQQTLKVLLKNKKGLEKSIQETKSKLNTLQKKFKVASDKVEMTIASYDKEFSKLSKKLKGYESLEEDIEETEQQLNKVERRLNKLEESKQQLLSDKASKEGQIKQLKQGRKDLEELEKKEKHLTQVITSYEGLIKFTGKDGYIVYDLEKIGEDISTVANEELLSYYEAKHFVLKFETLRKGKEVFDILVSINGNEPQELSLASSGERVCCNTAIKEAMSYIRQTKNFRTGFIDEIDGAMDTESRGDFLAMIRKAHKLNYRHHTVLISHSSEVINEIVQRIELSPETGVSLIY